MRRWVVSHRTATSAVNAAKGVPDAGKQMDLGLSWVEPTVKNLEIPADYKWVSLLLPYVVFGLSWMRDCFYTPLLALA